MSQQGTEIEVDHDQDVEGHLYYAVDGPDEDVDGHVQPPRGEDTDRLHS